MSAEMKSFRSKIATGSAFVLLVIGAAGLGSAAETEPSREAQGRPAAESQAALPKGVIGVSLHVGAERVGDPAVLYVAHVHPDGPAQKAGLAHGDEVTAVDGQTVNGKSYEQVVRMIRGEIGSAVTLSVKGEGGARDVSITRVAGDTLYKGGMGSHGGPTR